MNELLQNTSENFVFVELNNPKRKLVLIEKLLDNFNKHGILYCHWKSNEHLSASMTGDTDLDVLFAQDDKAKLELLLKELGFKKFKSIKEKQYKDIEDFIGLDLASGKVVHLHAHFRLTLGEVYLKGYQLNLEAQILNNRYFNNEFGIYCCTPAFELVLLYFREALKLRNRDIINLYLRRKTFYTGNSLVEYKWLREKVSDCQIEKIAKSLFENYQPIYELLIGDFNRKELLKLSYIIKNEFRKYRLYSPLTALALRWYREATVIISKRLARIQKMPIIAQRINPRGGVVVAIIGADGSGKSTVNLNLKETFSQKLDVYKIYFGRGDGNKSWLRKIMMQSKSFILSIKNGQKSKSHHQTNQYRKGKIAEIYKNLEALIVAYEKRKNLSQMRKAKEKGMLVVCDRFPQNQIMGFNDGPLLHRQSKSKNFILRAIARMEADVYALADDNPPDIVFKLIADATVVEARKPGETSIERLEEKISGIRDLKFKGNCKVVTVDASMPLEKVLLIIKREIWSRYL